MAPDYGALAEIVAAWPERFVGLGTVPLQNVDMAVAELERCVKKLGLRGVEINPNVNGMDLADPKLKLDKFFAKVQELGVAFYFEKPLQDESLWGALVSLGVDFSDIA